MAVNQKNSRAFEVTNAMVFNIAAPMTLAFLTTPLLGLVDTAVIGQLGDPVLLGGLAIGAILMDVLFNTFNFLRASTTGLVAQAMGANSRIEENATLLRSLIIAVCCGCIMIVISSPIIGVGLWAMGAGEAVSNVARRYFEIRILGAPLSLANYAILGWLLGLGKAGLGLLVQTILNCTNILLSVVLGLWLGWGIEGVAIATILGEGVGLLAGTLIMWFKLDAKTLPALSHIFSRDKFGQLLAVNRDILIRSFCLVFAFAFFTAQGSRFGEITLAANAVLFNFFIVAGYFLDGLATAAEQLVGRSLGAGHRPGFDRAVSLSLKWGIILAVGMSLVIWFAGPVMIDLLTVNADVRLEARQYLVWVALTAIVGVAAFQMDGVFIGATWSRDMRNMMILSLAVYLAVWWVAMPIWGNHGLWLAVEVFLGIRGISLYWRMKLRADRAFVQ